MGECQQRAEAYKLLVGGAGIGLLILHLFKYPLPDASSAVVFLLLSLASEWAVIKLPHGNVSMSFAVVLPTLILWGPVTAAWVSASAIGLVNLLLQRREGSVAWFNMGQFALSCLGPGYVYAALGGVPGRAALVAANIGPLIAFCVCFFVLQHALVGSYFSLKLATPRFRDIWVDAAKWDAVAMSFAGPIGVAIASLHLVHGLSGVAVVLVPTFMVTQVMRLTRRLDEANLELTALYEFSRTLGRCLDFERLLELTMDSVARIIPYDSMAVFMWDEFAGELTATGLRHPHREAVAAMRVAPGSGVVGRVAQTGQGEVAVELSPAERELAGGALLAVPMSAENRLVGVLAVGKKDPDAFDADTVRLLSIMAGQAGVALFNALQHRVMEQLAITDCKTGLFNYRYFFDRLDEEIKQAQFKDKTMSVIYIDVDHFKECNDRWGHEAGDQVLRELSEIIRRSIRDSDVAARYGGEEFVILLKGAGRGEALAVAERIRQSVAERQFAPAIEGGPISLTISAGVTTYPLDGDSPNELIYRADRAMYRGAKAQGRNKVSAFGTSGAAAQNFVLW
ncbi:MAG: sensor domain-containing diguanylate cyclase [Bacillota bacterium]